LGHRRCLSGCRRPEDILDRKVLFVDVIAFAECRNLLIIVKAVEVEAFVVILVGSDGCDGPAEIAHPLIFFGNDIQRLYPVAVVDAGEFALVVEVIEDLVTFHDIGGILRVASLGSSLKNRLPLTRTRVTVSPWAVILPLASTSTPR
jgi:hypothetical protein